MVQSTFLFIVLNLRRFLGTKVRLSERKTKFICDFPNRWSSESHHACMFGRVVTEENKVNKPSAKVKR